MKEIFDQEKSNKRKKKKVITKNVIILRPDLFSKKIKIKNRIASIPEVNIEILARKGIVKRIS